MKVDSIFVPIGTDCSSAHYLRSNGKRIQAFPFDWNVTPILSAMGLIQNGFADFMETENLLFLPPTERMLFEENGIDLKISNEVITPVLDGKYKILFPHDFSANGEEDLPQVKEKYERRILRLKQTLEQSRKVIFVYNRAGLNDWQLAQYKAADVEFSSEPLEKIYSNFENLKNRYSNVELVSLSSLQSSDRPLGIVRRFLGKYF